MTRDAFVPGESRPPSVLARPALMPPSAAARDRTRHWREAAAAVLWILRAWFRPAGGEARWELRAGRESLADETGSRRTHPRRTQGQTRTTGTGQ